MIFNHFDFDVAFSKSYGKWSGFAPFTPSKVICPIDTSSFFMSDNYGKFVSESCLSLFGDLKSSLSKPPLSAPFGLSPSLFLSLL